MGAAILENMPVTRSEDSTLFREISLEIFAVRVGRTATCVGFREIFARNVMAERTLSLSYAA